MTRFIVLALFSIAFNHAYAQVNESARKDKCILGRKVWEVSVTGSLSCSHSPSNPGHCSFLPEPSIIPQLWASAMVAAGAPNEPTSRMATVEVFEAMPWSDCNGTHQPPEFNASGTLYRTHINEMSFEVFKADRAELCDRQREYRIRISDRVKVGETTASFYDNNQLFETTLKDGENTFLTGNYEFAYQLQFDSPDRKTGILTRVELWPYDGDEKEDTLIKVPLSSTYCHND